MAVEIEYVETFYDECTTDEEVIFMSAPDQEDEGSYIKPNFNHQQCQQNDLLYGHMQDNASPNTKSEPTDSSGSNSGKDSGSNTNKSSGSGTSGKDSKNGKSKSERSRDSNARSTSRDKTSVAPSRDPPASLDSLHCTPSSGYVTEDEFDSESSSHSDFHQLSDSDYEDYDFALLGPPNLSETASMSQLIEFYKKDRLFASTSNYSNLPLTPNHSQQKGQAQTPTLQLRVLSWNILADGDSYALSARHNYTPQQLRTWSYRSLRIVASICAYSPDICALQETTGKMYHQHIAPTFAALGYDSLHVDKTSPHAQGDTILFRKDRFQLMHSAKVNLGELSDLPCFGAEVFGPTPNMFRSFLRRTTNDALLCKFRDIASGAEFIVVSSHLFWDPERPHIKAAQMFALNEHLITLLTTHKLWRVAGVDYSASPQSIMRAVPVVFACDANSVPTETSCLGSLSGRALVSASGVHSIMHCGQLSREHAHHPQLQFEIRHVAARQGLNDFHPDIVAQQAQLLTSIQPWKLSCAVSWRSAYGFCGRQPIFTNKVPGFADTIDYIFVTPAVEVRTVLRMPYEKEVDYEYQEGQDYEQQRYLQQRREDFAEFAEEHEEGVAKLVDVYAKSADWLLIAGFVRECGVAEVIELPNVVGALGHFFCSASQWTRAVAAHNRFQSRQSFWRMLQQTMGGVSSNSKNTCFNAWNYPLMPNRKDPSDHFALCCDVSIRIPNIPISMSGTETETETERA